MMRGPIFFKIWYAFGGYWIGSVLDNFLYSFFKGGREQRASEEELLEALMTVFAHVIHADGRIMHSEMENVRQFLRMQYNSTYQTKGEEIILRIFREKKAMPASRWERHVAIQCQLLAMYMPSAQRVRFLQVLVQMARADGSVAPEERQALRFISTYLGLGTAIVDQLLGGTYSSSSYATSSADTLAEAYRTLGIPSTATDDEVRKAYRKLALKYHPDKVATQGEAAREAAAAQFSKITEAKDRIYASRGIK